MLLLLTFPHLAGRIGRVNISGIRVNTADAFEMDVIGYSHMIALSLERLQFLPFLRPLHFFSLFALP